MYEMEFTPSTSQELKVGFDLTAEEIGGYTFNLSCLSIDSWSPSNYIQSVTIDSKSYSGGGYHQMM